VRGGCLDRASAPADVPRLPLNSLDALRAFASSAVFREALSATFVDSYVKLCMAQWHYARHLTDWEREHTLDA
jgi:glutamine synthetase